MSNAQQNAPQHSRAVPSAHSVTLNTLAPPRERGLFFGNYIDNSLDNGAGVIYIPYTSNGDTP
jgi:hypothetical protein